MIFEKRETQSDPLSRLVFELSKLPGIGEKTASRLAYHLMKQDRESISRLTDALTQAKEKLVFCHRCFSFSEEALCLYCKEVDSHKREGSVLCVVEKPSDVQVIERSGAHKGSYHVLHGVLSPLDGIGPEELKLKELLRRFHSELSTTDSKNTFKEIHEVIIALNPSVEGEATAIYLQRLLKPMNIRVTKLAYGLQVGGVLEYTDRLTLGKALENRVEMS